MPSMPQPVGHDQDNSATDEVVLGVDTYKDVHVAAVLTTLGVLLSKQELPGHRGWLPGVAGLGGHVRGAAAGRSGVHRPLTVRRWPGTCGRGGVEVIEVNQVRQGHPPPTR